ncbi:MAG: hypothetical protein CM1200mP16_09830 [Nitrospina sp.]|nr:MAG: hypothetical protein CM1200mP16_09830 [Nitrospina sp.]
MQISEGPSSALLEVWILSKTLISMTIIWKLITTLFNVLFICTQKFSSIPRHCWIEWKYYTFPDIPMREKIGIAQKFLMSKKSRTWFDKQNIETSGKSWSELLRTLPAKPELEIRKRNSNPLPKSC